MKSVKTIITFMLLVVVAFGASAKTPKNKASKNTIYAFGVAGSFTDSLTYITDIMVLDGATMGQNNLLSRRSSYSRQLRDYISDNMGKPDYTCSIIYNKDAKKLRKILTKMQNKYKKQSLTLLPVDGFTFEAPGELNY